MSKKEKCCIDLSCSYNFDSTSYFNLYQVEIYDESNGFPISLYQRKFSSLDNAKCAIRYFVSKSISIDSLKFWVTTYTYEIETFRCVDYSGISLTWYARNIFKNKEV